MKTSSFDAALASAARVACAIGLVGCVPAGSVKQDSSLDSLAATDDSEADSPVDSEPECSEDTLAADFADETVDSDTEACCQEVAEGYDANDLEGLDGWATRMECCELLEWRGSLACTPWGPPRPPSLRFRKGQALEKVLAVRRAALGQRALA
jgi:hypothetical protein